MGKLRVWNFLTILFKPDNFAAVNKSSNHNRKHQIRLNQTTAITVTALVAGAGGICVLFSDSIIKMKTEKSLYEEEKNDYPTLSEEGRQISTFFRISSGEEIQTEGLDREETILKSPAQETRTDKPTTGEFPVSSLERIPLK